MIRISNNTAAGVLFLGVLGQMAVPLAISAATVIAWGGDNVRQTDPCADDVTAIATGYEQTLLLKRDGTVTNFGMHFDPQGMYLSWDFPISVPAGLSNIVAVAGGYAHSLALKADGTVVAWGRNTYGQTNVPAELTNVVAISASDNHSLALRADGTVVAWGGNGTSHTNVPAGLTNVVAISAGSGDLALRADGTVAGWGQNPDLTDTLATLSNIVAISSGWSMIGWNDWLALEADGTVLGYNPPSSLTNIVAVCASSGTDHHVNLAVRADGTIIGWGFNFYGGPMVPADLTNVVAVSSDSTHSLALVDDSPPTQYAPSAIPAYGACGFSVSVPTQSGRVYRLEYKNSLAESDWTALPLVAGNGLVKTLTDSSATGSERYYRVRRW